MKDKEMIEEMAKDLEEEFVLCGTLSNCGTKKCSRCYSKYLYEQGYQNVKDKVVLSMDEWINFNKDHANELIKCAETEYEAGYHAGKSAMISEIKGILEDCAWDNGMMIVRALQDLIEKYGDKNVR